MAQKKIVIVDDDESIRKTFFLIFSEKYNVYLAKDSMDAFQRFTDSGIDLVITDLRLPGMDGLEMIREFRRSGYKGQVIMISAFPGDVDVNELKKLSIGYFFSKPLELESFTDSVDYLLDSDKWHEKRILSA